MSGFDSNPFADPSDAGNPFADPSVTQHTSRAAAGLEEYNPFADGGAVGEQARTVAVEPVVPKPTPPVSNEPAQLPTAVTASQPTHDEPPSYQAEFPGDPEAVTRPSEPPAPVQQPTTKAEPEEDRSAMNDLILARQEPNFPPLPKFCPLKPCFFHNINLEIPQDNRNLVRSLFFYWQFVVLALFINMIGLLAVFVDTGELGADFGFSMLWMILFVPCSFVCWYRCSYVAFRENSSSRFMFFFFVFFFQIVSCLLHAIGIPGSGSCGIIVVLGSKSDASIGAFSVALVAACMWIFLSVIGILLIYRIHNYYRSSGHSIERAQREAGTAVAQNESVRGAVVAGVKSSLHT